MITIKCDLCGEKIEDTNYHNTILNLDMCSKCGSKKLDSMLKEYNQIKKESDLQFEYVVNNMIKKYIKIKE